ncbi:MAG: hypothetical protein LBR88_09155 [Zoogloeaceae bacterium]|jgi:hypothetical protein|nr:hypothetical protein [Zoogloeaceae bacterium]
MSVLESGGIACEGYANSYYDNFTLDLIHGEYLDWNRLFKAFTSPEMLAFIVQVLDHPEWHSNKKGWVMTSDGEDYYVMLMRSYLPEHLSLHFDKPGHLALAISGYNPCCIALEGVYAEIPFADLGKILKPGARRYFPELKGKE